MPEFTIVSGDKFLFSNPDRNVGVHLVVYQNEELGLYEIMVQYPPEFMEGMTNINRIWLDIVAEPEEKVFGGGEQYSFLNLRGRNYPIWVREQGVGRNKSSMLTQTMDAFSKGGGDYHTSYWPQASFISSRKFYFESSYPTYSELDFTKSDRHTLYWHITVPSGEEGSVCNSCHLTFLVKSTLMEIIQILNPGQPALPDWVYNGAILGVQGGTGKMLGYLDEAESQGVEVSAMWIQDWSGKITTEFGTRVFWNWAWNSTWYPDLDVVIKDLSDNRNVKVTAYVTGHLNIDGDIYKNFSDHENWLTQDDGERLLQDFGQFTVATVDLIETPADCNCLNIGRQWFKEVIKTNMIDFGFDQFNLLHCN